MTIYVPGNHVLVQFIFKTRTHCRSVLGTCSKYLETLLILIITLWGWYYYPHFTDQETGALSN